MGRASKSGSTPEWGARLVPSLPEEGGSCSWWRCPGLLFNLRMLPQVHWGVPRPMLPIRAASPRTGMPQSPRSSVFGWDRLWKHGLRAKVGGFQSQLLGPDPLHTWSWRPVGHIVTATTPTLRATHHSANVHKFVTSPSYVTRVSRDTTRF